VAGAAGSPELLLYLQVSRGAESGRNHLIPRSATPTVFSFASPYPAPGPQTLEHGLRAVTLEDIRWARCDIKSVALLGNVLLRDEAAARGADEALLVRDGLLTEGSSSTAFLCVGGTLVTPPNDRRILPGTTRDAVLELAAGWLPVEIRSFSVDEMRAADEVWIASAGRSVLPITSIDGQRVGSGVPGPCWQAMHARLQQHLDAIASQPALEHDA
jgi:D-alanine transaminase